jgi:hypothetical protein
MFISSLDFRSRSSREGREGKAKKKTEFIASFYRLDSRMMSMFAMFFRFGFYLEMTTH